MIVQERKAGKALFLTIDGVPNALASTLSTTMSSNAGKAVLTIDEPKVAPGIMGKAGYLMSKEDQERVKLAITKATSMEEIRRLERSLRDGYLPEMESIGA